MVKQNNLIIKLKSIRFSINGDSLLEQSFWKHHGWKLYALLFSIILAFSISNNLNEFVDEQTQNWKISPSTFFSLLNDHFMVNLLTTVGLIGLTVYLIKRKWQDKYFSFSELILAVIACIFLCKQDSWDYASTVIPFINYSILLTLICAILYGIIPLYKCFSVKKVIEQPHSKTIRFSSDSLETQNISEGRKAYAESLTKQLLDSISINQDAFAVGITGEWGSGKSLFLRSVEEAFSDKAIIVKFNPWNSQDEQHLVKDYFDTLAQALAPYHGGILPPLKKYVSLLYSLKLQIASDAILQYLPKHEDNNLDKRRLDVENCLKALGRPVVVLIDDIDRLEGREIFEVLRIIRNTGQFSNMIYIVTFDKSHVETQLSKDSLGIDSNYLEKIFQLELTLPKADEKSLIKEFKRACRWMSRDKAIMNSLLDTLTEEDVHQLICILNSYRKVKRFARQFTFNSNFMYSTFIDSNFSLRDTLMLNLISSSNNNLYRLLWDNPSRFFKEKVLPNGYRCYLIENTNFQKTLSKINASDPEKYFLKQMFDENDSRTDHNSICFVDSYYKYFYLVQPEMELSLLEFNNMLRMSPGPNAKPGMRTEIRSWILSKDTKNISSIYHCFVESSKKKKKKQRDFNQNSNLITAAFYWLEYEYRNDSEMVSLLPQILYASLYDVDYHQPIVSLVKKQISTLIKKDNYVKTAKVLSALYVAANQSNLLVGGNMVLEWLKQNLKRMFTNNTWNAVLLFRDDGNPLKAAVSACCVELPPNLSHNPLIDDVISHFSKPRNQSKLIDEVDLIRKKLKAYTENNNADYPVEWDTIKKVFGDDMQIALRYLDECFQWNQ